MHVPSRTTETVTRGGIDSQNRSYPKGYDSTARSSTMYAALRCRAVGMCFSQHPTEQNRSFIRPVLHEATVQRTAEVPGGINLRHVAQTRLAMCLS